MNHSFHKGGCADSCCLRIRDLGVTVGSQTILSDINMHIHCGDLVALIGPNGAGKSTLIKAVLGQQEYNGVISFSSPGMRHTKPPRIGYVPQSPAFDPGECVSVADLFACCMTRRPAFLGLGHSMEETVLRALKRVHGADLIHKQIGTLSGGELQRVLLALALEPVPNILILDEPLSGVDAEGMHILMDMLDELRKTYDLSILMTTHDFSMLEQYADQAILINGTILHQGSPKEVLASSEFLNLFHMKGGRQL